MELTFSQDTSDLSNLAVPPCAIEAEQVILGGIMFDPNAIDIVSIILSPEHFYLKSHQVVYRAMLQLYEERKPCDLVFVTEKLTSIKKLDEIGGKNQIATLFNSCVTSCYIDKLAKLVKDKFDKRALISAGSKIQQLGSDTFLESEESISEAEKLIFEISQGQTGDRYSLGSASEMAIDLFSTIEQGKLEGDKFGWYDLEALTGGVHKSMLEVVAAESHMGKTHYLLATAYEIMTKLGLPVLYITPEMSKNQINTRLLGKITNIDSGEIITYSDKHWEAIAQGINTMSQLPWKVYDHSAPTTQMIASVIRKAINEFGRPLGAVMIDYLQQIPLQSSGNMAHEIGKVTRQIRDLAKYHEVPIYLGCQVNRSNQNSNDKRPNRHMLRNSGEIFEVCDRLVMLYRDSVYSKDASDRTIELIVEKNRLTGKVGTATMLCDLSTSSFFNMAR